MHFAIGSYKDERLCDMVPMDTSQILSDKDSKHRGFSNIYHIKHEGKRFKLFPLLMHDRKPLMMSTTSTSEQTMITAQAKTRAEIQEANR